MAQTIAALTLSKSQKIEILREAVDFKAFNDSNFQSAAFFFSSSLLTDSVDQPMCAAHLLLNSSSNIILSITLPGPGKQSQNIHVHFTFIYSGKIPKSMGNKVRKSQASQKASKMKPIKPMIP